MSNTEDPARSHFYRGMTDRERAIFEGAIGLASIYHQFIGTPVSGDKATVKALEEAIRRTTLLQPYKEDVRVKIKIHKEYGKRHAYDYGSLQPRDLDVKLVTRYGRARATSRMKYIPELDYVLMYVESVEEIPAE